MESARGWLRMATGAIDEPTGHRATSVAEFLAEKIDVPIAAAESLPAFVSNRSR